jgi:hypothetical protein
MAEYQLGLKLSGSEAGRIVVFLRILTGDQPTIIFSNSATLNCSYSEAKSKLLIGDLFYLAGT